MFHHWGESAGIGAAICWAIASLLYARVAVSATTITVYKNSLATIVMFVALYFVNRGGSNGFWHANLRAWWFLGLSAVIGLLVGDAWYFRSLQILGPRRGLVITALTPLVSAGLGWYYLAEQLNSQTWLAILSTVCGIIIVVAEPGVEQERPNLFPADPRWGVMLGIGSVMCQSIGALLAKIGMYDIGITEGTFIRLFIASVAGIVGGRLLGHQGQWAKLARSREQLYGLTLAAFLGTVLGVWLMLAAFKLTTTGVAATLTSLSPVFVMPLVVVFLRQRISVAAVVGAMLAMFGVALMFVDLRFIGTG